MNTMGISTDPALLDVELPRTLIESASVSTFLPEEEASICPLLSSNTNGTTTPLTFSHPLTPCIDNDNDSNTSANLCNEDAKVETSSSSGSSSGIGMSVPDATSTALLNNHSYKHLQKNNSSVQSSPSYTSSPPPIRFRHSILQNNSIGNRLRVFERTFRAVVISLIAMNTMGISTDPALLDVELPRTLIESASVSTFLPEEEASICPLLSSNTNGTTTPLTFSHPLTPCIDNDNDSNTSANLCNEDAKVETSSSSGSSSGIGMSVPDATSTALLNNHSYKHLQKNNSSVQDSNGHGPNGNLQLTNDTPSFVSWNWPLIRKCTFFMFMSSLLAMCAVVVAMIATLPRTCNPKTAWYRGSVFYEIFPASFQDSDNDGIGDLRGIVKSSDYLKALGVSAIRLNSIFPSTDYPDNYENITSLMEVSHVLGSLEDMRKLSQSLHARNISLILDIPLFPILRVLGKSDGAEMVKVLASTHIKNSEEEASTLPTARPIITKNTITQALRHWTKLGVDGFYIKGLEKFADLQDLTYHLAEWKDIIGPNRVLIVNEKVFEKLQGAQRKVAISHVDLVDVHLDIFNGTEYMENRLTSILNSDLGPTGANVWIHWSLAGVNRNRLTSNKQSANYTLAATIMQLMLPGTPNIFYGDEVALQAANDHLNEHNETKHLHHLATMQWPLNFTKQFTNRETLPWLPKSPTAVLDFFILISKMVDLRDRSPSIYKNSICKMETILPNTVIRRSNDDILIIERTYPRRNTFVSVTNFGQKRLTMDMTSMYYSGHIMLETVDSDKIFFGDFKIGPTESIVVRLDK